jgi:uncharacterized protein (TIGR00255 family)
MLLSMTGYGAGQAEKNGVNVMVEIRTVNNRYLKLHSRLPEGYAVLEPRIEETVRRHVRRGAVQLNLDVRRTSSADDYQLNSEVLKAYVQQVRNLKLELGVKESPHTVNIDSLLVLPGVVSEDRRRASHAEDDWPLVQTAVSEALVDLTKMRETEGQAMAKDLADQTKEIDRCAAEITRLAPRVVKAYQTRLTERLNKLLDQHDIQVQPADVVREVGVFAERADISEEIVRLGSHLDQFVEIMNQEASGAGRKLEFLVQELLRETNTIGSKANDAEIAKHVVQVKTCIERLREMVQNVE